MGGVPHSNTTRGRAGGQYDAGGTQVERGSESSLHRRAAHTPNPYVNWKLAPFCVTLSGAKQRHKEPSTWTFDLRLKKKHFAPRYRRS